MSSQSGIAPSDALVADFHAFTASPQRALILSIDTTALTIGITSIIDATSDLDTDLDNLASNHLTPTECLYIILKHSDTDSHSQSEVSGKHAFISYVPDNASVKSKLLYASTKNTLLRSLSGGTNFSPILFVNSADELTPQGWHKIVDSLNSSAPLSESEIQLQKVKQGEISTAAISKPARLAVDSSTNLLFAIDSKAESTLNSSNFDPFKLITLLINSSNETLELAKELNNIKEEQLVDALTEYTLTPAYHLYKNSDNQTFFILTCPSGSKVRERMLYATNKQGLINHLKQLQWNFSNLIEIGDPNELELSSIQSNSKQQNQSENHSSSLKFAKPKGPRRR
ncbi:hypothetical protein CANINC_003651 [Pichia inconspicua]|uniref:ADF-H domain-containing protein n=1 Tax=Pichia inconspicua TaxID=52247 RepID=A0A4T0WY38_9ASCO|nr:hypothetical protein CANINC_003651 [[Candida] inconspicua]